MINRTGFAALIVVNVLLACLIATQLYFANLDLAQQTLPVNKPAHQERQIASDEDDALPSLDLTEQSEEDFADMVERPLFIKGRRSVVEPIKESVPVAAVKKVDKFDWELSGIVTTPKSVKAFFTRTGAKQAKDNYRKCEVNEEIDGWKVIKIETGSVQLSQLSDNKTMLLHKPKAKTPMPMSASAPAQKPPNQPPTPPTQRQMQQPINQQPNQQQELNNTLSTQSEPESNEDNDNDHD